MLIANRQRPRGASDGCVPSPVTRASQAAPVGEESLHLPLPGTAPWAQSPVPAAPCERAQTPLLRLLTLKSRFRSLDEYSLLKATLATKITFHEILLTVNALTL